MNKQKSKESVAKEFGKPTQTIDRDIRNGLLTEGEKGFIVMDELYEIRKKQCKLKVKQDEIVKLKEDNRKNG